MQDLILLLATVAFLAAGFVVPFVLSLGYVWVDIFGPHLISASILAGQPVSLIMGAAALGVFFLTDRKSPPRFTAIMVLQILLCLWITATTQWAVAPILAEDRWNLAVKAMAIATFLPFVFRTRVQIEAFVLVYLFSIAGHIIPWGLKTFLAGGGYNMSLGLATSGTTLLQESSTLSAVCVMIVPILLAMRKNSVLLPRGRLRDLVMYSLVILGPVAAIGTFARTALVAFGVGGIAMWLRSKRKILFLVVLAVMAGVMFSVTSDRWTSRIETAADYQSENSAYVRILVWRWALDFLQSHPFGGGFGSYAVNQIQVPSGEGGATVTQYGRAFHNVFVALLGEHGYIGFILYVSMLLLAFFGLQKVHRVTRASEEHKWCSDLAQALQIAMATIYSAGMFVEIGWSPLVLYLVSMSVCLREYVRRVCEPTTVSLAERMRAKSVPANAPLPAPAFGAASPGFSRTAGRIESQW